MKRIATERPAVGSDFVIKKDKSPRTVILRRYQLGHFAHLDRAKLADEGIESFIRDDEIVSLMPYLATAFGGIKLIVFSEDAERARQVLDRNDFVALEEFYGPEIEPLRVCPKCSSADIMQRKSILSGLLFLLFFFVPLATPTHSYICLKCGHSWREEQGT